MDHIKLGAQLYEACGQAGSLSVYEALAAAAILHANKNKGYASNGDPLDNFKSARCVQSGILNKLQYAHTLMEKQDDALSKLVWSTGPIEWEARGGEEMFRERALDGVIYRCLMVALRADDDARAGGLKRDTQPDVG